MADKTKIEWADATVNAINGCTVKSPGCTNCYAMKQAHRFDARRGLTSMTNGGMVWTGEVRLNERQLLQPLSWKRPRHIFWNAHGDTFHPKVPDEWIDKIFGIAALTPQHTHLILTKRSDRQRAYINDRGRMDWLNVELESIAEQAGITNPNCVCRCNRDDGDIKWPLPNVWLGVSVEDQTRAYERIPDLLATPAAVRFLSCEPLLGPVDLIGPPHDSEFDYLGSGVGANIDWVIAGGESGSKARPSHPDWFRSLRDQCAAANVPFHFKQWGEWFPGEIDNASDGTGWLAYPDTDHDPDAANWTLHRVKHENGMLRVGKKRAARRLDGVIHDAMPGQPGTNPCAQCDTPVHASERTAARNPHLCDPCDQEIPF